MLMNFSGIQFSKTVSEFKKREREKERKKCNLRLVFASSFKRRISQEVLLRGTSCNEGREMYKRCDDAGV